MNEQRRTVIAFFIILILVSIVFFSCGSSGPSKENYDNLVGQKNDLEKKNTELQNQIESLNAKLKELQQTPSILYEQAIQDKQNEKFDDTLKKLKRVAAKAAGADLARSATKEIIVIEKLKFENKIAGLMGKAKKEKDTAKFDEAINTYQGIIKMAPGTVHARKAKTKIAEVKRLKRDAFVSVGNGFSVRKVKLRNQMGMFTEIVGEMKNISGNNWTMANFLVSLYDANGDMLGTGNIIISNFANGSVKSFNGMAQVPANKVSNYKIQFENAM